MPSLVGYGPSPTPPNQLFGQQAGGSQTQNSALQSQQQLETQIARQVNSANPNADVSVQYSYAAGPNGQLAVTGATVTVTEEQPLPQRLGGTGNTNNIAIPEDIIDISQNQEADGTTSDDFGLNASEREVVRRLQAADADIRRHEGLHFRAAGGLGSSPEFQTVQGPDGKFYAVAGSVGVSGTRGASPEKAAREAQTLELAATAPGDTSAQDIAAARQFAQQGSAASQAATEANQQQTNQQEQQADQQRGDIIDLFA